MSLKVLSLLEILSKLQCICMIQISYIEISNLRTLWSCLEKRKPMKFSSAQHHLSDKDKGSKILKLLISGWQTMSPRSKRCKNAIKSLGLLIILLLNYYQDSLALTSRMCFPLVQFFTSCKYKTIQTLWQTSFCFYQC